MFENIEKKIILERNEYLKVKGNIDRNIYFVESGSLKIFVLDDCEEQIIRFAYKNNMFALLDSYLSGKPTAYYVQAIKKTVLKVQSKQEFEQGMATNPQAWQNILENLILQQMEREIDILTASPRERYLRVLRRSPALFQEVPHRYIANYLRMSPETLSRLKSLDLNQEPEKIKAGTLH